jgi:HAD superfamily hydrolase (TIGR01490 family)
MSLAIFDLDNTLLNGDSDHAWGEFLIGKCLVDSVFYKESNDRFYREYQLGKLDIYRYVEFALEPLTRHDRSELDALHAEFMRDKVAPMRLRKADALLQQHRDNGDFLLIITATNSFVTRPIAQWLGVDDIIATEPEFDGRRFTGRITGTPSFREGKVTRLREWLARNQYSLQGSWFYSDSQNDLPLLELVDNPVAVDPDDTLRAEAIRRGWQVISLRD